MYNLIIIDDESWILKDMEQIIDWQKEGYRLVAACNNVELAESLLRRRHIDVVISDIRMPGKNGFDLISYVKRVSPHTLIIFISAYSEFSYAKKAIEEGCFNYLLKPVNDEELIKTLTRCSEYLKELEMNRKLRQTNERTMMCLRWFEKDPTTREIAAQLKAIGFPVASSGSYLCAVVKSMEVLTDHDLNEADKLLHQFEITFIRGQISLHKQIYFLIFHNIQIKQLIKAANRIAKRNRWEVGISLTEAPEDRLSKLYHRSNLMAHTSSLNGSRGIYRYKSSMNEAVPALKKKILNALKIEHLESVLIDIQQNLNVGRIHLDGLVVLYNHCIDASNILFPHAVQKLEPVTMQDVLYHYESPHDMLEELQMLVTEQKKPESNNAANIIEEISRELDRQFAHRISLKELARKYYISPNYLSQLFKQEKGQSFIHYLIAKRLEVAVELLQKDISLYEVGKLVGYDDYAHFSKLFKKHIGVSPFEYKQNMKI